VGETEEEQGRCSKEIQASAHNEPSGSKEIVSLDESALGSREECGVEAP